MNQFKFKVCSDGDVRISLGSHPIHLSLDDAYEFQYGLAAFLAEIELKELPMKRRDFHETRRALEEIASLPIRKFDA